MVSETGYTDGLSLTDAARLTASLSADESDCILARPELNTTRKLNREIEMLRNRQFDVMARSKIDPKLKAKAIEKVYFFWVSV